MICCHFCPWSITCYPTFILFTLGWIISHTKPFNHLLNSDVLVHCWTGRMVSWSLLQQWPRDYFLEPVMLSKVRVIWAAKVKQKCTHSLGLKWVILEENNHHCYMITTSLLFMHYVWYKFSDSLIYILGCFGNHFGSYVSFNRHTVVFTLSFEV